VLLTTVIMECISGEELYIVEPCHITRQASTNDTPRFGIQSKQLAKIRVKGRFLFLLLSLIDASAHPRQ